MFKIAFNSIYSHPLPEGHRFPMLKYELIPEQLLYEGLVQPDNFFSPGLIEEGLILDTHKLEYWEKLKHLNLSAPEIRRIGFPLSESLVLRERMIAQGTVDCCSYAMNMGVAFNVAGGTHHAGSDWGEGFCLLNDQAIAANYLLKSGQASRILIVDLDVHQGNGTAEIFQGNPSVFTFSMHADKNFPFRKEKSDLDIALPNQIADAEYLHMLNEALETLFEKVKPDFVFYLAGVDVLKSDKLGHLSLSREGCKKRDTLLFQLCRSRKVPVQVSMGGGYSSDIKDIVEAHCNTFRAAFDSYF